MQEQEHTNGPGAAVAAGGAASADAAGSFGAAMDRLEAIVARLESEEMLALEEALALYEQGQALAAECRRRLSAAQLKVTEIPVDASEGVLPDAGR
jgi:exodeoxyribonuclease VII small subunit